MRNNWTLHIFNDYLDDMICSKLCKREPGILGNVSLLTSSVYYALFGKLDIRRKIINMIGVVEQSIAVYKQKLDEVAYT